MKPYCPKYFIACILFLPLALRFASAQVGQPDFPNEMESHFTKSRPGDSTQSRWTLLIESGTFNIDFSARNGANSASGNFKTRMNDSEFPSHFISYDSRGAMFDLNGAGPLTDQANRYFGTLINERNGWLISLGVIHDKWERTPGGEGNTFRYNKGGSEWTLMAGRQFGLLGGNVDEGGFMFQAKAGGYLSFNYIAVDFTDSISGIKYTSWRTGRRYAGMGMAVMASLSYDFALGRHFNISPSLNGTFMMGRAMAHVSTSVWSDIGNGGFLVDRIRVNYASVFPGVGINLKYHR